MVTNGGEGPDSVKVIRDGILIKKSLEGGGQSPVPRVRFDLISKREDTVDVRFVDPLPETLSSEQVVFDPDEDTEYTVRGPHSVTFEARLQPGREYVTHYTVREPPNGLDGLLQAPQLESVEVVDVDEEPTGGAAESADRSASELAEPVETTEKRGGLASLKGLLTPSGGRGRGSMATEADEERRPEIVPPSQPGGIPATRTTTNGISVVRRLSLEQGGLLASIEVAATDRDGPVTVVVRDPVPGAIPLRDIEFHPSYSPDSGRISGDVVSFRLTLDPEQRHEIKYGAIPWGPLTVEDCRQVQTGLTPQFEIYEAEAASPETPDVTFGELFGEEPETDTVAEGDLLFERIVRAIEADDVDAATIDSFRNRLEVGKLPGSLDARIRHLESKTAEFSAYAETIQAFLDQHGPAAAAFEAMEDEITALRSQLEEVEDTRSAVRQRLDRLATELEQVDEASASRVRRLRDQLDSLESVHGQDVAQLEATLEEIQGDLESLHSDVEAEQERWSELSAIFD